MNLIEKIRSIKVRMQWKDVILYALASGVYTGLVMMIPFLKDTSFQDIGISFEWWVLFAVIVVCNAKSVLDATLKCFVFFLISQPLVYLVQVIFGCLSLDLAINYYTNIWFWWTLLTIPGGAIAYFCKKQNALGAVILGLGNSIVILMGASYISKLFTNFPNHLLTAIFCILSPVFMTLVIQQEKKNRIISLILPLILLCLCILYAKSHGLVI